MFVYDGKHLLVDAACSNQTALVDLSIGQSCLERVVREIDMTMILPPIGVKFPHAVGEMHRVLQSLEREGLGESATALQIREDISNREHLYYGYSTFVMIAESHLSLHTFPEAGFLTFDCYSCKDFDNERALAVIDECFGLGERRNVQVIPRPFHANLLERRYPLAPSILNGAAGHHNNNQRIKRSQSA